jgi:predicted MFS family arabinose efflux permease
VTSAFFGGFFSSLYFLFAIRDLGLTAAVVGVIISVGGAGSLVGALAAERLVRRFGFGPTLIGSSLTIGIAGMLVPFAHGSATTAAAFLIAAQLGDVAWPIFSISETTLRQAVVPGRLLGRVNSAMHLTYRGVLPLGALAGGLLAAALGVRPAMLIGAAGLLLSSLWLVFSPVRSVRSAP